MHTHMYAPHALFVSAGETHHIPIVSVGLVLSILHTSAQIAMFFRRC